MLINCAKDKSLSTGEFWLKIVFSKKVLPNSGFSFVRTYHGSILAGQLEYHARG